MWTFETNFVNEIGIWVKSRQRFNTKEEAIDSAIEWTRISLENDVAVSIRIVFV